MTTNPNLLFALGGIASTPIYTSAIPTTVATPLGLHMTLARAKDPRHGCINGVKFSTCKMCAGHVLRGKVPCTRCTGTGFVGARCNACVVGALLAQKVLIKEIAADFRAEDDKRAESHQKQVSTTEDMPGSKQSSAEKDTGGKETMAENVASEEAETSEEE
ncbi:hypothetical protein QM012_002664 [Aureobasidium pullulans]|uniref:Uncharacterized protein n=1 Tax=Aureobasidium pullulans TaxID=5580 RepID=A0ABR0TA78_AURPU